MAKNNVRGSSSPLTPEFSTFLPVTFRLAALSDEDREVVAYLITIDFGSRKSTAGENHEESGPVHGCDCFECYVRYWSMWDKSPNCELIHEIIEEYEMYVWPSRAAEIIITTDHQAEKNKKKKSDRNGCGEGEVDLSSWAVVEAEEVTLSYKGGEAAEVGKRSVKKLLSYVGQKVWGVRNK
ncbi:unnamed protein product [Rhodiola kirilowii]